MFRQTASAVCFCFLTRLLQLVIIVLIFLLNCYLCCDIMMLIDSFGGKL